jgi:predicted AAA+ superfamily ATPase
MVERYAKKKLIELASYFKCVAVTGARQSGKTTLVRDCFPDKPYVSLENLDNRRFAIDDPRGFLAGYPNGAILDEVQRTPDLFSYIQEIVDNSTAKGLFILTGSNNFLLQASISQSLAGRVGYLQLLPFSIGELNNSSFLEESDVSLMIKGFYPPVYDQQIPATEWCQNYIRTYIEKDVRQIKNITDLLVFERFMKLLAGRTAQEFNSTSLALETGVDVKTIQSWVGILESSYIIYLLKPHFKNFNKTIVKRPKIFFYDTSLVCSLLGIKTENQLDLHPSKGAIFETMVVSEFAKTRTNNGQQIDLYYWRDKTGHEVDLLIDKVNYLVPIEIKSSKTIHDSFFKNLSYYSKLSDTKLTHVVYSGLQEQNRSNGIHVINWREYIYSEKYGI